MGDIELLREWVEHGSEDAFKCLVDQHIDMVYATARRLVYNPHEAEEVTQTVFVLLAKKAATLAPQTILPGWLHTTTRYVSAQMLRTESRRNRRMELLAQMELATPDTAWERIQPFWDEALSHLATLDRDAVILRFMEEKSLSEIGDALGATEEAARKRVHRAVEKLRLILSKRGIRTSSDVFIAALSGSAMEHAPVGLAATVSVAALTHGTLLASSTSTLVKSSLKLMAWSKIKATAVAGAVLLTAGSSWVAYEVRAHFEAKQVAAQMAADTASQGSARPETVVGIGTGLTMARETADIRILKIYPNSPAEKAGLSPGLILKQINNIVVDGLGLSDCVDMIRGDAGTKVSLVLVDPVRDITNTIELTRQPIQL
ncbi:MAG TPA: sigma-70 family RNA polymerase sigma factor [Candidatus Limnocylindria bacterium]|nr:sigma-70 family RNA polymerase sigma factor [Candidatus Limnocylindria bacterium]